MKFKDEAIIISSKQFSENKILLKLITKNNLFKSGIASASSTKSKYLYQIGNVVSVEGQSKNLDSLFKFSLEPIDNISAKIITNPLKLMALNSLMTIVSDVFSFEYLQTTELYNDLYDFISTLPLKNDFIAEYIFLELQILKFAGFGLDIMKCAVTETTENLTHISPKSGKAVCYEVAKEYEDKLFKIPKIFQLESTEFDVDDLLEALKITKYFLEKFIYNPRNLKIIEVRNLLCEFILKYNKKEEYGA